MLNRVNFINMRRNRLPTIGLHITGINALALIVLAGFAITIPHCDRETYRATVTRRERIVESDGNDTSSKYLIFTRLENGKTRVFENTDSLIEWKFNSSDIYGDIEEGKTYDLKTYGWRAPLLSMYENVISIKEVKK